MPLRKVTRKRPTTLIHKGQRIKCSMPYLTTMVEIFKRISRNDPINADDDTTPGEHSLSCDWGFCSQDFTGVRKQINATEKCPFDQRSVGELSGCFYKCVIFQGRDGLYINRADEEFRQRALRIVLSAAALHGIDLRNDL